MFDKCARTPPKPWSIGPPKPKRFPTCIPRASKGGTTRPQTQRSSPAFTDGVDMRATAAPQSRAEFEKPEILSSTTGRVEKTCLFSIDTPNRSITFPRKTPKRSSLMFPKQFLCIRRQHLPRSVDFPKTPFAQVQHVVERSSKLHPMPQKSIRCPISALLSKIARPRDRSLRPSLRGVCALPRSFP